jgi:hypothetical protein
LVVLALSMLSGGVTFNILTKLHNTELLNKAIKNIPLDINVRIWPKETIDHTKLCRPCEVFLMPELYLTWNQSVRHIMHKAREEGEEWVGQCHDDCEISTEDLQKIIDATKTVPPNIHIIQSHHPTIPEYCAQVYVLYNTKKYWEAGGHDTMFMLYWSDVDYDIRQKALGNEAYHVVTPSVYHEGSATLKRNTDLYKAAHNFYFAADKAYCQLKHPSFNF